MGDGTFTAERSGECAACGGELKGKRARYGAFDEVVHVTCPPKPKICPSCFIQLPATGVCEECS